MSCTNCQNFSGMAEEISSLQSERDDLRHSLQDSERSVEFYMKSYDKEKDTHAQTTRALAETRAKLATAMRVLEDCGVSERDLLFASASVNPKAVIERDALGGRGIL